MTFAITMCVPVYALKGPVRDDTLRPGWHISHCSDRCAALEFWRPLELQRGLDGRSAYGRPWLALHWRGLMLWAALIDWRGLVSYTGIVRRKNRIVSSVIHVSNKQMIMLQLRRYIVEQGKHKGLSIKIIERLKSYWHVSCLKNGVCIRSFIQYPT